jgi:hypothetical protein
LRSDGTAVCWGKDVVGESTPPAGTFVEIAAAVTHTCGLRDDGRAVCWGYGGFEQVIPPAGGFSHIAADGFHA